MPRSWQGRGRVCCAGGQSTRTGWSCPGPRAPPRSGIPAHHPRGPRSRTAPGPTAHAVGGKHRGVLLSRWPAPGATVTQKRFCRLRHQDKVLRQQLAWKVDVWLSRDISNPTVTESGDRMHSPERGGTRTHRPLTRLGTFG